MRIFRTVLLAACFASIAGGCAARARLEMGGLTREHIPAMAENFTELGCDFRRGLGRYALSCPGIVYPESTVHLVIYLNGRVECIAPRDQEDDCPVIAEALLR